VYFVIDRAVDGHYFYRIIGANHETMAVSQYFASREAAESAVSTIKREAARASVEDMTGANRERRLP
jgi:uncharacterized protein YegP (UPF0339 family)